MARRRQKQTFSNEMLLIGALVLAGLALTPSDKQALVSLLVIAILAGVLVFGWIYIRQVQARKQEIERMAALSVAEVDAMSGVEFERFVGALYERQGYKVQYTPATGDYGVDLIINKNGVRTAVQTKRYVRPITQAAIREVVAGAIYHRCTKCVVVTSSVFTPKAQDLAAANSCVLIDRNDLAGLLVTLKSL